MNSKEPEEWYESENENVTKMTECTGTSQVAENVDGTPANATRKKICLESHGASGWPGEWSWNC